jgi:threonyl-tRNA synthetase
VQVTVIPISDRHLDYAYDVRTKLAEQGLRVEVYADNEPMRIKIAKAQQQKTPYMLIVGDKEAESGTVGVRERTEGDIGSRTIDELVAMVKKGDPLA